MEVLQTIPKLVQQLNLRHKEPKKDDVQIDNLDDEPINLDDIL